MMKTLLRFLPMFAVAACLLPDPAAAHSVPLHESFTAGLAHPLGGLDHILAMVAVGLWASLIGGRALWALPVPGPVRVRA